MKHYPSWAARSARRTTKKDLCHACDAKDRLLIHHVDHDPFNNDPKNLMVLCYACHGWLHAMERWDESRFDRQAVCRWCGIGFVKERNRQTTCSRSCGNKLAWSRKRVAS